VAARVFGRAPMSSVDVEVDCGQNGPPPVSARGSRLVSLAAD
jgi:hypothetical protein